MSQLLSIHITHPVIVQKFLEVTNPILMHLCLFRSTRVTQQKFHKCVLKEQMKTI